MGVTIIYKCDLCGKKRTENRGSIPLPSQIDPPNDFAAVQVVHTLGNLIDQHRVVLCYPCASTWDHVQTGLLAAIDEAAKAAWRAVQLEAKGAVVALGELAKDEVSADHG